MLQFSLIEDWLMVTTSGSLTPLGSFILGRLKFSTSLVKPSSWNNLRLMIVFQPINTIKIDIIMLKLLCSPTCNYIINLTVSELFTLSNLFTNLAQAQILILILKCTCILKKLTLQPSFPVYASFLFSRSLQLILSKYATETEDGIDKNTYFFFGTAFICIP